MPSVYGLNLIVAVVWDFGQIPGKHEELLLLSECINICACSGQTTSSCGETPFASIVGSALKRWQQMPELREELLAGFCGREEWQQLNLSMLLPKPVQKALQALHQ